MTSKIDIDALESRRDDLIREYVGVFKVFNGAIEAYPSRADLRTLEDRRDAAARDTEAARKDQARIADELIGTAERAVEWANSVLDGGDYSNGLDGLDNAGLLRVFDRSIMTGKHDRALAAAQLLEADGDNGRAMHLLAAQSEDVRVALEYMDAYRDPANVLNDVRMATVQSPDDRRIGPNVDVARRLEKERRDEYDAAVADARRQRVERETRLSGPVLPLQTQGRRRG